MQRRFRFPALLTGLLLALGTVVAPARASAPPALSPSTWSWTNPRPQGRILYDVTVGAGRTVALGMGGTIITADGSAWTQATGWTDQTLSGIAYGGGRFVAVGDQGTIMTSVDGSTWVRAASGTQDDLMRVTYAAGRFVAVSYGGSILTSADGTAWTKVSTGEGLLDVAYGGGQFVAVGLKGQLRFSPDGLKWAAIKLDRAEALDAVVYAGDHFVIATDGDGILTSTDGTHWRTRREPARQSAYGTGSLAYGNGKLIAADWDQVMVSADGGATWDVDRTMQRFWALRYAGGSFVAVGGYGQVRTSKDGKVWTNLTYSLTDRLNGVAYGAGRFVAAGGHEILTSPDGQTWASGLHAEDLNLFGVWYGNGRFTALGEGQRNGAAYTVVLRSSDGRRWQSSAFAHAAQFYAGGNGRELLAGADSAWLSADGSAWSSIGSFRGKVTGLTYGNGRFLFTTDQGLVYTVTGDSKATQIGSIGGTVTGLVYGGGTFVAVGFKGFVAVSADGASWQTLPSATDSDLLAIAYANGQFVAAGTDGRLIASTDGRRWSSTSLQTGALNGVAFGADRWVVAGNGGAVLWAPGSLAPACLTQFADVAATYPACSPISSLTIRGIISGYPDGTFRADRSISRAEFSTLLTRALRIPPDPAAPVSFADARDHWVAKGGYLQPLIRRNLIMGFPDGTFRPDATITRAQAVALLVRAGGLSGTRQAPYADVAGASWYAEAVNAAFTARLMGRQADTELWDGPVFRGDEPLTRAEAAMLLANYLATQ